MRRVGIIVLLSLAAGCSRYEGRGIVDKDVTYKVPAIKQAVEKDDKKSAAELVNGLTNEDAAVRFFSIGGLKRLTGQTFDYHYYDEPRARRPAVARWKQWLAEQKISDVTKDAPKDAVTVDAASERTP